MGENTRSARSRRSWEYSRTSTMQTLVSSRLIELSREYMERYFGTCKDLHLGSIVVKTLRIKTYGERDLDVRQRMSCNAIRGSRLGALTNLLTRLVASSALVTLRYQLRIQELR